MPARKKDGTPARKAQRKKITDAFLRTVKPKAAAFRVWDTYLPHLCVRVWPSGKRVFYVHYCRGGRHRWYCFGPYPAVSLEKAHKKAHGVLAKVYDGGDPVADKQAQRDQSTVAELHQRYVDQHARRNNK